MNTKFYLVKNQDVAAALEKGQITSAFAHYAEFGRYESRQAAAAPFGTVPDPIVGNNKDDVLYASSFGSYLIGGNGNDVLVGGIGTDSLEGSAGSDEFVFQVFLEGKGGYGGNDQILDYEINFGTGDIIKLKNAINGNATINLFPVPFQSITLLRVTAAELMTRGIEINGQLINATTLGLTKSFGTYTYTVGNVNA